MSNQTPLTIVTVSLNSGPEILKTGQSLQPLDSADYEWLVIDGGSTDNSINNLKILNNQPKKIVCEKDNGIYNAMNKGLKLASGKYILFLNAGDQIYQAKNFKKIIKQLDGSDLIYADAWFHHPSQDKYLICYPNRLDDRFFINNSLCHQATFYLKSSLKRQGGFDEKFHYVADWHLSYQWFLDNKFKLTHCSVISTIYDLSGISSAHPELMQTEKIKALRDLVGVKKAQYLFNEFYQSDYGYNIRLQDRVRNKLRKIFKHE